MSWVLVLGLGWVLLSVLAALLIGRAIHLAGEREPAPPIPTVQRHTPRSRRYRPSRRRVERRRRDEDRTLTH